MTKLANEIVEIINSRNEYMEKQAGLSSFMARKVVKPVSRALFGMEDKLDATRKMLRQKLDILGRVGDDAMRSGDAVKLNDVVQRAGQYVNNLKFYDSLMSRGRATREAFADKVGLLGGAGLGSYITARLATREPTFSDVINNYIEKIKK